MHSRSRLRTRNNTIFCLEIHCFKILLFIEKDIHYLLRLVFCSWSNQRHFAPHTVLHLWYEMVRFGIVFFIVLLTAACGDVFGNVFIMVMTGGCSGSSCGCGEW